MSLLVRALIASALLLGARAIGCVHAEPLGVVELAVLASEAETLRAEISDTRTSLLACWGSVRRLRALNRFHGVSLGHDIAEEEAKIAQLEARLDRQVTRLAVVERRYERHDRGAP